MATRAATWLRDQAAWAWRPALIAIVSRVFSVVLILALNELRRKPATNPFAIWDGNWYLRIVRDGYHGNPVAYHPVNGTAWHDFAFFPGWPAAVKGAWISASPLDISASVTGTVLANLVFIAAAVVAWRVIADRMGPRAATAGVALLAFAPSAYAFSMVYSESLFVLLAALSFLPSRSLLRAPFTAAAMLTRIAGAALVASALVEAVLARGRERRAAIAAAAGGVLAFGIWWAFAAWLTGSPTGYLRGSAGWNASSGLSQLARVVEEPSWQQVGWVAFAVLAIVAAAMLLRRNRELGVYAIANLALIALPGSAAHSWPRYLLAAFPLFAALGERLGPRGSTALVVAFAVAQVVFAGWTITSVNTAP